MNQYLTGIEMMKSMLERVGQSEFSRATYTTVFEQVYQSFVPGFDAIEALYKQVGEPMAMIENMAAALTDSAQERLQGKSKREQEKLMMDMNLGLAVYIFPAILQYKGSSSKPLCEAVLNGWKNTFPKTNVQAATYETIEKGFHKKFCYITTAVCQSLGKGDDCDELNLLRRFRDGYMMSLPQGKEMIGRYYDVAPTVVKHINRRQDAEQIYAGIWEQYIHPCMQLIAQGKNAECAQLYTQMVGTLQDQYFVTM